MFGDLFAPTHLGVFLAEGEAVWQQTSRIEKDKRRFALLEVLSSQVQTSTVGRRSDMPRGFRNIWICALTLSAVTIVCRAQAPSVRAGSTEEQGQANAQAAQAGPPAVPAVEVDSPEAEYQLGVRYARGLGVSLDYAEALKWWTRAAQQGHRSAQNELGYACEHGRGTAQNVNAAFHWYQLSANQGLPAAQYNLAFLYERGLGVSQDYKAAA